MRPPLVGLSQRAPFLHDGCAATLEARFGACHTEGHGHPERLDEAQLADLVVYLESL